MPNEPNNDDEQLFVNHYTCYRCGQEWTDIWDAQSDDDCPRCEARHNTPTHSEDLTLRQTLANP